MLKHHLIAGQTSTEVRTACGVVGLPDVCSARGIQGRVQGGAGRGFVARYEASFEPDRHACQRCVNVWAGPIKKPTQ